MSTIGQGIFEEVRELPDTNTARRFSELVGLDETKTHLLKEAKLLLDKNSLTAWSEKHHGRKLKVLDLFHRRTPLFLFAGDVGTGKTALAESFGDPVARESGLAVTLYSLSLRSRGSGAVGEMTSLIGSAFDEVRMAARKSTSSTGKRSSAIILLIDEADALAQSREMSQMHHEDRAGVNALIRGVDYLASEELPVIVVMCTNRIDSIDPAVRRRAAVTFIFTRPNDQQRYKLLESSLSEVGLKEIEIRDLVIMTGPNKARPFGYTYSDITQRFLPGLLIAAYPSMPISYDLAKSVIEKLPPTPPFKADSL